MLPLATRSSLTDSFDLRNTVISESIPSNFQTLFNHSEKMTNLWNKVESERKGNNRAGSSTTSNNSRNQTTPVISSENSSQGSAPFVPR